MYRIRYEQGNGYHCSCCRNTYVEESDCSTEQEVIEWLSELEACKTESVFEDDDDRNVIEILSDKQGFRNLMDEFKADPKIVEKLINKRKSKKQQKETKKKEEAEKRERLLYKRLKVKYENGKN